MKLSVDLLKNKKMNIMNLNAKEVVRTKVKNYYGQVKDFIDNNFLKFQNEIIEHTDSYTICIEMHGYKKDEVSVQTFENKISVVVRKKNKLFLSDSQLSAPSSQNSYRQVFHLEQPIDSENTIANLYTDTLEIYLPKKTNPKDINITQIATESPMPRNYNNEWASQITHIS